MNSSRTRQASLRAFNVDVVDEGFEVVVGLRDDLAAEGVGLDDVGTGFEEAAVDVGNDFGFGQAEHVAVALEVLVMVLEPLPAKIRLAQLEPLQRRPHRAVDDDNALLQQGFEGMDGERLRVQGRGKRSGLPTYQRIWMRQYF